MSSLAAFAEPYGLTADAVRADVERVLAGFRELGLLTDETAGPTS